MDRPGSRDEAAPAIDQALRVASYRTIERLEACVLVGISIFLIAALLIFLTIATSAINAREFSDESEYLVAAQMMVQGSHLYKDVLMQHGPVPLMIAHFYAAVIDRADFSYFRVAQILLVIGSCFALFTSPVFKTWGARALCVAVYLALLSSVWLHYWLNMVLYQSIAGYLFVIILAQCIVPLYFGEEVTRKGLIISGFAFSLAVFSAYPFILTGSLLFLSYLLIQRGTASMRSHGAPFLIGGAIGTSLVVIWLAVFADIGGYGIYHIYFNQEVYSAFIDYSPSAVLKNIPQTLAPENLIPAVTVALMAAWICIFIRSGSNNVRRSDLAYCITSVALIAGGVLFTNPRGETSFHSAPFFITNFALFSMAAATLHQRTLVRVPSFSSAGVFAASIIAALSMRGAVAFAANGSEEIPEAQMSPMKSDTYDFVRSITEAEGDLLVLPYDPIVYVRAERLPASGAFFYLPWHAAYAKAPVKGYRLDICSDIQTRRPAVIWFYNWRVWDKYSLETYEPCLLSIMSAEYAPIAFDSFWHVRKDVLEEQLARVPRGDSTDFLSAIQRSSVRDGSGTIGLTMTPEHLARPTPLRRIGILFASNDGEAMLILKGPNGAEMSTRFDASGAPANDYRYFDLAPAIYTLAEIWVSSGDNVAVWQDPIKYACMIYEYVDGSRGYTPTCPIAGAPHGRDKKP